MVPKLDFYIIDLGSFSKLHFDEVSLFQYAKVSEVVYILYIYICVFSNYIKQYSSETEDFLSPRPFFSLLCALNRISLRLRLGVRVTRGIKIGVEWG